MNGIWVILEGSNEAVYVDNDEIIQKFKLKDGEEIFEPHPDQKSLLQTAINRLGSIYRITDSYPKSSTRIVRTISDSEDREWMAEVFYLGTNEETKKHILKYVGHQGNTMQVIY